MINIFYDIIKTHYLDIISIVTFAIALIILWKRGRRETVRKVILSLVVKAEKELGSGTGQLKYAIVVERIYFALPWVVRIVFTQKEIDNMIEDAVNYLKMYLSNEQDGPRNLLGYSEES